MKGYDNNRNSKNSDMGNASNMSNSGKPGKMDDGSGNADTKNKSDKNYHDSKEETLTDSYDKSKNKNQ